MLYLKENDCVIQLQGVDHTWYLMSVICRYLTKMNPYNPLQTIERMIYGAYCPLRWIVRIQSVLMTLRFRALIYIVGPMAYFGREILPYMVTEGSMCSYC